MNEIWKPIPGAPSYEASSHGRVRSIEHATTSVLGRRRVFPGRLLSQRLGRDGRPRACVFIDGHARHMHAHTLVCAAFHGARPVGHQCCHNDGDPLNNTPENLRWDTPANNWADMRAHGTAPIGEAHRAHKLSAADVRSIRAMQGGHETQAAIAAMFGVSQVLISRIWLRKTWKHI